MYNVQPQEPLSLFYSPACFIIKIVNYEVLNKVYALRNSIHEIKM